MFKLALVLAVALAGCVAVPADVVYPSVRVQPSVEIVYQYDPIQYRYFWIDERQSRHYMPRDWHDDRHEDNRHGDKHHKHDHRDNGRQWSR